MHVKAIVPMIVVLVEESDIFVTLDAIRRTPNATMYTVMSSGSTDLLYIMV